MSLTAFGSWVKSWSWVYPNSKTGFDIRKSDHESNPVLKMRWSKMLTGFDDKRALKHFGLMLAGWSGDEEALNRIMTRMALWFVWKLWFMIVTRLFNEQQSELQPTIVGIQLRYSWDIATNMICRFVWMWATYYCMYNPLQSYIIHIYIHVHRKWWVLSVDLGVFDFQDPYVANIMEQPASGLHIINPWTLTPCAVLSLGFKTPTHRRKTIPA